MLAGAQWERLWTCRASLWWKQPSSRGSVQSWSRQSICSSWPAGRGAWTHTLQGKKGKHWINAAITTIELLQKSKWFRVLQKQQERSVCVFAPLPGWRVYAKVFLIDCVERSKVFHGPHIQVDQGNVFHLPASAVQLTWTQATHYTHYLLNHWSVAHSKL